jgi:hypothetical protein
LNDNLEGSDDKDDEIEKKKVFDTKRKNIYQNEFAKARELL